MRQLHDFACSGISKAVSSLSINGPRMLGTGSTTRRESTMTNLEPLSVLFRVEF